MYEFMVDIGAMVPVIQPRISLAQVQPCDVQAMGVTGTQLEIIGEQKIEFKLKTRDQYVSFVHTFIVSTLERCSSGILGMDFLQSVGVEISLTAQLLHVGSCSFPLKGQESEVATVQRLINAESEQTSRFGQEEGKDESEEDWGGTVELAEAVTVPSLSVRIARCRVVRRDDKTNVKVPRYQEVLVEPEGLPGVYMARIVATLEHCGNMSSSNVGGSPPLVVNLRKSPLAVFTFSPHEKCVAGCDGNSIATHGGNGFPKAGSGEYLPEAPEGGLPAAATSHEDDLQVGRGSLPVENQIGNQVDTPYNRKIQKKIGQSK